jgi:hypothetical protein
MVALLASFSTGAGRAEAVAGAASIVDRGCHRRSQARQRHQTRCEECTATEAGSRRRFSSSSQIAKRSFRRAATDRSAGTRRLASAIAALPLRRPHSGQPLPAVREETSARHSWPHSRQRHQMRRFAARARVAGSRVALRVGCSSASNSGAWTARDCHGLIRSCLAPLRTDPRRQSRFGPPASWRCVASWRSDWARRLAPALGGGTRRGTHRVTSRACASGAFHRSSDTSRHRDGTAPDPQFRRRATSPRRPKYGVPSARRATAEAPGFIAAMLARLSPARRCRSVRRSPEP